MNAYTRLRKIDERRRHLQTQIDTARQCGHFSHEYYVMRADLEELDAKRAQLVGLMRIGALGLHDAPESQGGAP